MKGKVQIILLSMVTSILTSWITFTTLALNADADSANTKPIAPIKSQIYTPQWGTDSNPTTQNFITTTWDSPNCQYHYSTDKGDGSCYMWDGNSYDRMVDPTPTGNRWVAKNYGARCPAEQIMVGFQWGYWGNRYALIPICQSLKFKWVDAS